MQTCLFFLYPHTAIAAIAGIIIPSFIVSLGVALLCCIFFLLAMYWAGKPKRVVIRFSAVFAFVFSLIFFFATLLPFPTNPKINSMQVNQSTPSRLIIYTKDVVQIAGCSDSTAMRKLHQVKDVLAKKEYQEVTIKEYCAYYSLDYMEICQFLKLLK